MNKEEYSRSHQVGKYKFYRCVQKLLKDWMIENNITEEICDVHHRNDTEECRKYNEEHYELWGFEFDEATNEYRFELGKFVQFMTHGEHARYHQLNQSDVEREKRSNAVKGSNNPFFGKHHSDIARQKMSIARKGKSLTNEHKKSMCESMQVKVKLYEKYKSCGGTLVWNDFRRALANNEIDIDRL